MRRSIFASFVLAAFAAAQPQPTYVDVFIAKVKPEKRSEFDVLAKKLADANRKNKGDNYLCADVQYGEQNTLYFTSARPNLAAIDAGSKAFEDAMGKAFGPAAAKVMDDITRCTVSTRGELRRIRQDLSAGTADVNELMTTIGKSRFVRTVMIRVRPGHGPQFEEQLKMTKSAGGQMRSVSQSAGGQNGTYYYVTSFGKSMGDLDTPGLPQLLGNRYAEYSKMTAENVLGTETIISKFLPELSSPPEQIAAADPGFWNPKPKPAAAKPKPGTGAN
jgi:hypothetical protein